jgi:protein-L-isoaspartate O-methyltransferase
MAGTATHWDAFWSLAQPEHRAHRAEAEEYVRRLDVALALDRRMRVLDYGCGFGFAAAALSPRVHSVAVWDKHQNMRDHALRTTAHLGNVAAIDLSDPSRLPAARFDLILVNSVVQYMTDAELAAVLPVWRALLADAGRVVVSDLIPVDYPAYADVLALVRARPGSALRRLWGNARRYAAARSQAPLRRVSPDDLARHARAAGLTLRPLARNVTHFARRYAVTLEVTGTRS